MHFAHPQTPESPSRPSSIDFAKQVSSPTLYSLPTPAHSTNDSISSTSFGMSRDEFQNKRKRDADDIGSQDFKRPHIEDARLRLNDLHLNVGKKYKLCHNPKQPATPDLRQDLFALYGLEGIAKSVARTNPDGSKGVRLRKTYKNHIKDHQLSGNFDSVKKEIDAPDSLYSLMLAPEDRWDIERSRGEAVETGLPISVKQLMGKAFKMNRGTIPKTSWNNSMLGDIFPLTSSDPTRPNKLVPSRSLQQPKPGIVRSAKAEGPRPKRSVKKRTYGDTSYEGYGEGYVDDEAQEGDYKIGEGEAISRKRPKKSTPSHGFQGAPTHHNSYGPGMVGA